MFYCFAFFTLASACFADPVLLWIAFSTIKFTSRYTCKDTSKATAVIYNAGTCYNQTKYLAKKSSTKRKKFLYFPLAKEFSKRKYFTCPFERTVHLITWLTREKLISYNYSKKLFSKQEIPYTLAKKLKRFIPDMFWI